MSALAAHRAVGQNATPAVLPADVTACRFDAYTNHYPSGADDPPIRDAPRGDARVLGQLPRVEVTNADFSKSHQEIAEFRVIGFKDGWFLIEGAHYPEAAKPLYSGQGWIEGKFIATNLYRDTLKKAPNYSADDVVYLNFIEPGDGIPGSAYTTPLSFGIMGCSGPWFEVEVVRNKTPSGKPLPGNGLVRGWTDRSCTQQDGPCSLKQFDYPWSRLPAGVMECNFGAVSNDRDPAGLSVLEAPDSNAAILGHLLPPLVNAAGDAKVREQVQVIGFRKGWFLIEAGPNLDLDTLHYDPNTVVNPPPGNRNHYIGRGWVPGDMLTAWLLRSMLKQAPDEKSADVVDLSGDNGLSEPQEATVRRIIACSGDWVHVEVVLEKDMKPLRATDAPPGAVRGWANGTCSSELETCAFNQGAPWSPPAPLPPE
jgi:hypothetical protein